MHGHWVFTKWWNPWVLQQRCAERFSKVLEIYIHILEYMRVPIASHPFKAKYFLPFKR